MKLVLGVKDIPYGHAHGDGKDNPNITTGDVAEILEANYGIMGHFFDLHEAEIVDSVAGVFAGLMDDHMAGIAPKVEVLGNLGRLKPIFQNMIIDQELDGVADGVPTKASLGRSVNHRKKKGVNTDSKGDGVARPSFYDTHLYADSFQAWIE